MINIFMVNNIYGGIRWDKNVPALGQRPTINF